MVTPTVEQGDLLRTGFPAGSFDAVLSQCAFFVSGDVRVRTEKNEKLRGRVEGVNVAVVYESVTAYYNFDADGQPAGFKPADWTAKILDSATSSPTPETP